MFGEELEVAFCKAGKAGVKFPKGAMSLAGSEEETVRDDEDLPSPNVAFHTKLKKGFECGAIGLEGNPRKAVGGGDKTRLVKVPRVVRQTGSKRLDSLTEREWRMGGWWEMSWRGGVGRRTGGG